MLGRLYINGAAPVHADNTIVYNTRSNIDCTEEGGGVQTRAARPFPLLRNTCAIKERVWLYARD